MTVVTVSSEGAVTLDKELLESLSIGPGDKLAVLAESGGRLTLSLVEPPNTPDDNKREGGLEAFFGSLKNKHNLHFTIDEINASIEEGWASEMRLDNDR